ncbi:hypothetical protein P872_00305 [Rhodonellum psychrophilum GCM71 = DSM 17998]|uniref:Uncharacterized protein n=3 Tax=Cytophagaceae TaxID=89373 RepID=U5C3Q5_9BACT|nr:hypothetical protein P872_00305 [Rhodonellum psychrophilum GCM71 = DSM 17998]SDY52750.1 hypothetical protein SAMN05444412_101429 [Rhodonellum ikkaensis]
MNMKRLILLFIALAPSITFAQFDESWNLPGYTPIAEIVILDQLENTEGIKKTGDIFSKAKGVFSISAINTIQNRAMEKLKTEASLRGASHLYIKNFNPENSVFSKTASYSASTYRQEGEINFTKARDFLKDNQLQIELSRKYNRNAWKVIDQIQSKPVQRIKVEDIQEKGGRVLVKIFTSENQAILCEVIGLSDTRILLTTETRGNEEFELLGLGIRDKNVNIIQNRQ